MHLGMLLHLRVIVYICTVLLKMLIAAFKETLLVAVLNLFLTDAAKWRRKKNRVKNNL